jgi:RNase P/RNase MRP subunit p30
MDEFFDLYGVGSPDWTRAVRPVIISSKDVQQDARRARKSELVMVQGDDKTLRLASDCWELDLIGSPEIHNDKDFMHQMNSGIDYVIARACAEKGIAIEFCFANVLNSHGRKRSQILARMSQNVVICRYSGCDMVITSGASEIYASRAPRDLMAFGIVLGMSQEEAKNALSANPKRILDRSARRRDQNIILNGLEVKKWASEQKEKRLYGWY